MDFSICICKLKLEPTQKQLELIICRNIHLNISDKGQSSRKPTAHCKKFSLYMNSAGRSPNELNKTNKTKSRPKSSENLKGLQFFRKLENGKCLAIKCFMKCNWSLQMGAKNARNRRVTETFLSSKYFVRNIKPL